MLKEEERKQLESALLCDPEKLVLSNSTDKSVEYRKIVITRKVIKEKQGFQIEKFTQRQAFHENIDKNELFEKICQWFPDVYGQLNVFGSEEQWDFKFTKKGRFLMNHHNNANGNLKRSDAGQNGGKRIVPDGVTEQNGHNRKKNYLLKEGTVIAPLVDLGIFTKEGKIVRTMYDKYRQINRFLELVEDVVKDYPAQHLHIVDFGCGKSYLTFILYYYLVEVKGYLVEMTGLDLKADVIEKCNATADKYGYSGLHFEIGNINGYRTEKTIDMVVALHACDTATDYALYNAIQWKAGIILSVPCCQHELNGQMESETFSLLTKYGIVKERMSALMTDAIRANVLTMCGYRTQILEFVDFAASPKNLLIRAVRGQVSNQKKEQAKEEIEKLCTEFSISQTLVNLVKNDM